MKQLLRILLELDRYDDAFTLQDAFSQLCRAVHEGLPLLNTPKILSSEEEELAKLDSFDSASPNLDDDEATMRKLIIQPSTHPTVAFSEIDWRLTVFDQILPQ